MSIEFTDEELAEILRSCAVRNGNPTGWDDLPLQQKRIANLGIVEIVLAMEALGYRISRPLKAVENPTPAS